MRRIIFGPALVALALAAGGVTVAAGVASAEPVSDNGSHGVPLQPSTDADNATDGDIGAPVVAPDAPQNIWDRYYRHGYYPYGFGGYYPYLGYGGGGSG